MKVPDFLPATQKALFMRIHGKRVPEKDSGSKNVAGNNLKSFAVLQCVCYIQCGFGDFEASSSRCHSYVSSLNNFFVFYIELLLMNF